jgi:holo-[acyl-carrier-protein] synthase
LILSIGIDIEEKSRILSAVEREPVLLNRLSGDNGRFEISNFVIYEAFYKAMGCPTYIKWGEIKINRTNGRPQINAIGEMADRLSGMAIHLSVSHTDSHILAVVVIEKLNS